MSEFACPKCGVTHSACSAHNRNGKPCGREPRPYQRVCFVHGGASPAAVQAAARREAEGVVTATYDADPDAILAAQGIEPIMDPLTELGRLAASAKHFMDALGARVNALDGITEPGPQGAEQLASEVALFERAMDRTAKLLSLLLKSGIEERKLKLDEQTAGMFVTAMQQVLARLELTPEQAMLVGTVVPDVLRGLEA